MLRLVGFSEEATQKLLQSAHTEEWRVSAAEDVATFVQEPDTVWVVCLGYETVFRAVLEQQFAGRPLCDVPSMPRSVLWIPPGQAGLPYDDWWDLFNVQLFQENEDHRIYLERIVRNSLILVLNESMEDRDGIDASERLSVIQNDPDCQEEVQIRMMQERVVRQVLICPSEEIVAAWLEGEANPALEKHVQKCTSCQETIQEHAWFWAGAGLISEIQARARLEKVGLLPRSSPPFLEATLDWPEIKTATALLAVALVANALRHMTRRSGQRNQAVTSRTVLPSEEQTIARLSAGDTVRLWGEGQLVTLKLENETLVLSAGRTLVQRFSDFYVALRRGNESIVVIPAVAGEVRLLPEHLQKARQEGADQFAIVAGEREN